MGTEHSLKTEVAYFEAIKNGSKTFEVRRDDRGFQKGDTLLLRKYGKGRYADSRTGYLSPIGDVSGIESSAETIAVKIQWILTGGQHGIEPGYVIMAIALIS